MKLGCLPIKIIQTDIKDICKQNVSRGLLLLNFAKVGWQLCYTTAASLPCHRKVGGVRRQDGAAVLADVLGTSQSAARGPVGGQMVRRLSSLEPFDSAAEWWTVDSSTEMVTETPLIHHYDCADHHRRIRVINQRCHGECPHQNLSQSFQRRFCWQHPQKTNAKQIMSVAK